MSDLSLKEMGNTRALPHIARRAAKMDGEDCQYFKSGKMIGRLNRRDEKKDDRMVWGETS